MKFAEAYFHTIAITAGTAFLLAFSGVAQADTVDGNVQDHYRTVTNKTPYQQCYEVEVPVYGDVGGSRTEDIIGGAIIGGIIGNQIGDSKGNGAAGAVIGGLIGNNAGKKQGVVGYRKENRCETKYNYTTEEVYSHSTVTFYDNGKKYTLRYNK
jgi:uncharacterized protein YcfJ